MHETRLGSLRLVVEDRAHVPGGGPTLRVYDAAEREVLRFDCFERGPHWHIEPCGRDERTAIARDTDPVAWTLGALRGDLNGLLGRAGVHAALPPELVDRALVEVERALRGARSAPAAL